MQLALFQTQVLQFTTLPLARVLTRLGYRSSRAESDITQRFLPMIQKWMTELKIRTFQKEVAVEPLAGGARVDGEPINSLLLQRTLGTAKSCFLLAASVEQSDWAQMRSIMHQDDLTQNVILDAVASEKVDYALDYLSDQIQAGIRRMGKKMGMRISCGYNDFLIDNQRLFHEKLALGKYGIKLNERYVLDPEKTVTGIAPVLSMAG
jgi:hypothetical protein